MVSGILGQAAPAASTNTTVYAVPVGKTASATVALVNRGSAAISVRVALATSDTPSSAEWIEYGAAVPANGVLERTGLVMQEGRRVVVYCSTADASASVYGFEE